MNTYNFRLERYVYTCPPDCKGIFRDARNGVQCEDPTLDMECYYNYLYYLNSQRGLWKNFGYLDVGMMPVAMGPSFMQSGLITVIPQVMDKVGIKCYRMKPVSLLFDKCNLPIEDLWVFREDVGKYMGTEAVTVERFLRRCFDEVV